MKDWIARLRRPGYIRTEYHSNLGFIFWIFKAKHKTRARRIKADLERAAQIHAEFSANLGKSVAQIVGRNTSDCSPISERRLVPRLGISRPKACDCSRLEKPQPFLQQAVPAGIQTPTPEGFTPEDHSYHNTYPRHSVIYEKPFEKPRRCSPTQLRR